jgi:hypothetical protein
MLNPGNLFASQPRDKPSIPARLQREQAGNLPCLPSCGHKFYGDIKGLESPLTGPTGPFLLA